jgi:hypothetical protein
MIFYVVTPADSVRACVGSALEHSAIKDRVRENSRSLHSNTSTVRERRQVEKHALRIYQHGPLWRLGLPLQVLCTPCRELCFELVGVSCSLSTFSFLTLGMTTVVFS